MPTKGGITTVKDIVENFLESTDIKIAKDETYDYVMGLYDQIVAVPYNEYKCLLKKQEEYDELEESYNNLRDRYDSEIGWCEDNG
jgi:hypothetical protein